MTYAAIQTCQRCSEHPVTHVVLSTVGGPDWLVGGRCAEKARQLRGTAGKIQVVSFELYQRLEMDDKNGQGEIKGLPKIKA